MNRPLRIKTGSVNRFFCGVAGFFCLALTGFVFHDDVINYFGTATTLDFNGKAYTLAWSSHPNEIYYKHEYVPKGDDVKYFTDLLMIDFIQKDDITVKDAVQAQINTLNERKKTDLSCNYSVLKSPDGKEYVLDFLMSEASNDIVGLVEWSGYHYKPYTDSAGHKGVLLLGISHRAYSNAVNPFYRSLSKYRQVQIKALLAYPIPLIQVK